MKRTLTSMLFLFTAVSSFAQTYYNQPYDPSRRDRALFDKTRSDLDRASGYPYASRDDIKRFDDARRELFDFESRFGQGRYERRELDEAIDRLRRVVERNSLDPRDRGALADDLRMIRDFRELHNRQGYWR